MIYLLTSSPAKPKRSWGTRVQLVKDQLQLAKQAGKAATIRDLSEATGIAYTSVSAVLSQLRDQGLVERTTHQKISFWTLK